MKYPCGLIQDLLPLYVENMTSEESRAAVEEHLQECSSCQQMLGSLRKQESVVRPEMIPLKKVKKGIFLRKWKTVAAAVCVVLAAALSVISYLMTAHYLPYTEDLFTVIRLEDGSVRIQINEPVSGYMMEGNGMEYSLEVWKESLDAGAFETIELSAEEAGNVCIYYVDYRNEDVLIYGKSDAGRYTLPHLVLNYYLLMAGAAAVVLGILYFSFRRKKAEKVLFAVWMVPVCYLAGHLCIKGVNGLSFNSLRDFWFIFVVSACWYGAVMLFGNLRKEKNIGIE